MNKSQTVVIDHKMFLVLISQPKYEYILKQGTTCAEWRITL